MSKDYKGTFTGHWSFTDLGKPHISIYRLYEAAQSRRSEGGVYSQQRELSRIDRLLSV
jgi:hypothetical protein